MNPILFEDLADSAGILKALDRLEAANKKFADSAVSQNERIKASQGEMIAEIARNRDAVAALNNAQKSAKKEVDEMAAAFAKAKKAVDEHNQLLERNQKLLDNSTASVTAMKARLRDLKTEYDGLDRSEQKNVARQKQITAEIRQTSTVLNGLAKTVQIASRAVDTAERSYAALDQQTIKLRADLRAMSDAFDPVTGKINKHNAAAVDMHTRITANDKALKGMDAQMGNYQRNVGNYGSALSDFTGQLTGITSVAAGVMLALGAIKMGVGIAQDMERYNAMLKAVSRDSADFSRSQQFLITLADKLGLQYGDLVDSYKGLKAATKDTVLEGKETEHMFSAVATAGAKLRLSNETVTGTLLALTQMISKGHIQAEELRGQLGERLPGALKLMAEALGVSEVKLNTMMAQGQLIATEVMPQFADALDKAYGLKQNEKIESMTASTNRLKNETSLLIGELNKNSAVTSFFSAFSDGVTNALRNIRLLVKDASFRDMQELMLNPIKTVFVNTRSNQRRQLDDMAQNQFQTEDAGTRKARIQVLMRQEFNAVKDGEMDKARSLQKLRLSLLRADLKLTVSERQDSDRKAVLEQKAGIEKNETDLTRFQKQAVRKRTAELIALEKQLVADPKNEVAAEKLRVYSKLDAEAKAKDNAVADRLKRDKPAKIDGKTPLEIIDKQIKSIESTLQSQALQDLKAGRIIDVDPTLVAKVRDLKVQYEAIRAMQKAIEDGTYNKKIEFDVSTLSSISTVSTGRTQRIGKDKSASLTAEQVKAEEDRIFAIRIESLQKQAFILQEYDQKRNKLAANKEGFSRDQQQEIQSLLDEQLSAERAGQKERVAIIEEEIRQKKDLYREDLANRKAVIDKSVEIGMTLVNGLFEIEQAKNQQRIAGLERQKEFELSTVGDNAEAKAAIEEKYDTQRKVIQRQQDVAAQQQALFNIAVSTAVAAVQALPNVPLAIAIAILGAVQAGIVLARPLPQYKDGKNVGDSDGYSGPALVGEAGRELWVHDGIAEMVDSAKIVNVGSRDTIYPNHLTEKLLSNQYGEGSRIMDRYKAGYSATQDITRQRDAYQARQIAMAMGGNSPSASAIGRAVGIEIAKHPKFALSFDKHGFNVSQHDANTKTVKQRSKHSLS